MDSFHSLMDANMKKMICSILMFIMMSFLVSCGSKNVVEDEKITSVENNIEKDTTIDNIEDNTTVEQIEKETKTLVVYLSVTGNTEKIAQTVSDILSADLY